MDASDHQRLWKDALLCLNAVKGLGPAAISRWMACVEDPQAVVSVDASQLKHWGIPAGEIRLLEQLDPLRFLPQEKGLCQRYEVRVLAIHEADYPDLLKQISDPPAVLYVKGNPQSLWGIGVALVGSRRPSGYGLVCARRLSAQLAQAGCAIVSGLAKGIDAASHKACLENGGQTIAVLGCGLSHVYPKEHHRLADRIAERGCLVSEFPMDTPPRPGHFPRRNRIISGLSWGVVVVEAYRRSGALVTARWAADQGREVFAVPGHIDEPLSVGPHQLIRDGAVLVTDGRDVVDVLWPLVRTHYEKKTGTTDADPSKILSFGENQFPKRSHMGFCAEPEENTLLSQTEDLILEQLKRGPLPFEALVSNLGHTQGSHGILLAMEANQLIERLPGRYYRLKASGTEQEQQTLLAQDESTRES